MRQQRSGWIWGGRIAAVMVVAGLAAYLSSVGLDKADKLVRRLEQELLELRDLANKPESEKDSELRLERENKRLKQRLDEVVEEEDIVEFNRCRPGRDVQDHPAEDLLVVDGRVWCRLSQMEDGVCCRPCSHRGQEAGLPGAVVGAEHGSHLLLVTP